MMAAWLRSRRIIEGKPKAEGEPVEEPGAEVTAPDAAAEDALKMASKLGRASAGLSDPVRRAPDRARATSTSLGPCP